MLLSIGTPLESVTPATLEAIWLRADRLGFAAAYLGDHLLPVGVTFGGDPRDPVLEAWTTLAALAARTSRIRVGTLVTANTFRHPGLLAKMAATVDAACGGRLVLGLGAGYHAVEHAAFGIPLPPPPVRLAMLEEACTILRGLWSGEPFDFAGAHYRLEGAVCKPRPAGRIPLVLGASGERLALRVAARHADRWDLPSGPTGRTPDDLRRLRAVLDGHCREIGRSPAEIDTSLALLCVVGRDRARAHERSRAVAAAFGLPPELEPRQIVAGDPAEVADRLAAFAEAGLDEFVAAVVPGVNDGDLELLAERVLPAVAPL